MNIEDLRQIRNKNVAQQNELTYLEMKQCAESIEDHPWISTLLEMYGQCVKAGLLISLHDVPDQEGTLWYGSWISLRRKFYDFEALTSRDASRIINIESWTEVSPEISPYKKGIGKTPAYIALELLSDHEKS